MSEFAIATGHRLTTEAGAEILRAGGNAVDAAIACAFMACVSEPVLASPLAGGFMLIAPADAPPKCLDMFVQTPNSKKPDADIDVREIGVDFGQTIQKFHCGAGTTATPGLIPGIFEAHDKYGRMPLVELVSPAITSMREGVELVPFQAEVLGYVRAIFQASEEARLLYEQDGALLVEGQTLRNPEMADVLDVMAVEGPRFFQEGEVATALLSQQGSQLTESDLKNYRPIWRDPISIQRQDIEFSLNPSPSLGGVQIALALMALPSGADDVTFARCLHQIAKIRHSVDLDLHPEHGQSLLLNEIQVANLRSVLSNHKTAARGTTHISVIDQQGLGAGFTISNGEGNGLIVPGTGIMANNMLGEDDLMPNGPNSWYPNRRLASMMCPMVGKRDGETIILGSGGSNRIRSALSLVADQLASGRSLRTAIEAPRLHIETANANILDFEDFGDEARYAQLRDAFPDAKSWPKPSMFFGGVHAARLDAGGGYEAVGDMRRAGVGLTQ